MKNRGMMWKQWVIIILLGVSLVGCGIFSGSESDPTQDSGPTPTPTGQGALVAPEDSSDSPCQDLAGRLEIQILVGPAEAVGLEPVTVGEIPFEVLKVGDTFLIEGGGQLDSYSDVLSAEWGTYTVTFEGDTTVNGTCISTDDDDVLNLVVEMTGDQNVEIIYEGTQLNYPWSGTTQIEAGFPIQEGAQQEGEGWILILHLDQ